MFVPYEKAKPCLFGEDNLRAFLADANVPAYRIEDAAIKMGARWSQRGQGRVR